MGRLESTDIQLRESPVSEASPGPSETPTDTGGGPQETAERPWWRRMFGG